METLYLSIIAISATIVASVSMLISVLSTRTGLKRSQFLSIEVISYRIITAWNEIESLVISLEQEDNYHKYPKKTAMSILNSSNILEESDLIKLKKFLQIRNSLVHSNGPGYSREDMLSALEDAENIIEKLKIKSK